jgi:hypothetical protein
MAIPVPSTFAAAYRAERAEKARKPRNKRTPLLVKAGRLAARHVPSWKRARTAVLQVSAFGCIDYGLFEWHTIAGLIGTGVSLLILETLSGGDDE